MQVSKTQGQNVQPKGVREIWTTLVVGVTFASAEGASLKGVVGVCTPRKFSNLKALKRHFQPLSGR